MSGRQILPALLLAFLSLHCGEESTEPQVPPGPADASITVNGAFASEYYIYTWSPTGSIAVELTGPGISGSATLTPTTGKFVFSNLPRQTYLITARQDSCYRFSTSVRVDTPHLAMGVSCIMVHFSRPYIRVDSILCTVNRVTPRIAVRLMYPFTLPAHGYRSLVLLAGPDANVSTRLGTYVFVYSFEDKSPPTFTEVDNIYPFLQWSGIMTGQRVYLTARLRNPATVEATDGASGLSVFSNIESNTTAVASFIMP